MKGRGLKKASLTRGINMETARPRGLGKGSHAHQTFVTRSDIVPRDHCDTGPCCRSWGYLTLQWPLPGEQLSEEAAASLEAIAPWVILASFWQKTPKMWKQRQEANAHGCPRQWQPLLHKRHGPAAGQGHGLPPVPAARGVPLRTATQPSWKHLEHSETEELIKVQVGHGGKTCSDLLAGLGPYLRENRSIKTSSRTSKGLRGRQEVQGIPWPAKQTVRRKQLCTEDDEATMRRLRKMREKLQETEDKVYEEMFRAIFSSLDDTESPMRSKCILSDASSLTLEPAAGPSVPHGICRGTNDATGETQTSSELVSPDQLLADSGPVMDNSPPANALVKESAGEAENKTEIAHPDLLAGLCSVSGNSPSCAFSDELLEMCEEEELYDGAAAEESDSEPDSPLSLSLQEEEGEPPASPMDTDPCIEYRSQPLPTALLQDLNMSVGCPLPADPAEEAGAAGMEAGCARAAPPQEKPCGDEPPAGPCPVPAQPLARSVPAWPAGSAAVPQPPAPRRWRSMAKRARRALRRLFSFSCLCGQPEQ